MFTWKNSDDNEILTLMFSAIEVIDYYETNNTFFVGLHSGNNWHIPATEYKEFMKGLMDWQANLKYRECVVDTSYSI